MAAPKATREVGVKVSADIKDALRSIAQVEKQVQKLQDLADQGERRQGGFLSPKQVQLFRNLVDEMQKAQAKQVQKYENMSRAFTDRMNRAQQQQQKAQQDLARVQGGNKWGDVASPRIVDYHERKLSEANEAYERTQAGPGGRADISRISEIVKQLEDELSGTVDSVQRINQMHEMDPRVKHQIQGLSNGLVAAGGVTSIAGLVNYMGTGKNLIRDREAYARSLAQQGEYEGSDRDNIVPIEQTGLKNGFNSEQTMLLQSRIMQGGSVDQEMTLRDVQTAQTFNRSYGVNSDELASSFGVLRRMGTMEEGDMQRLADLIGGAIAANQMNGREEELLRATTMLMGSVSQGMTELSQTQAGNVLSMQAALGDAIPTLRGEAGAQLLGGMDAAIKAQDPNGDILLGKGSRFTGIEGYYDLEMQKAQGLTNPENLQTLLSNIQNNFVGKDYQQIVLRDWVNKRGGNMSLPQSKAFMESGLWDDVVNNDVQLSQEQLAQYGLAEQTAREAQYRDSETATRQTNEAAQEIRQRNVANEYEATGTWVMDKFNQLPDWAQKGAVVGGGIGGAILGGKVARSLGGWLTSGYKTFSNPIGGAAQGSWLSRMMGKMMPGGGAAASTAPTPSPSGLLGPDGRPISSTSTAASTAAQNAGRVSGWSKFTKGAGKILGPLGFVAGANEAVDIGDGLGDWVFGHKAGQAKSTGLFGNPFKPEYYEEDRDGIGRRFMNWFSGEDNIAGAAPAIQDPLTTPSSTLPSTVQPPVNPLMEGYMKSMTPDYGAPQPIGGPGQMNITAQEAMSLGMGPVDATKLSDTLIKPWESMWDRALESMVSDLEYATPTLQQEHTLRVIIDGKIDGMAPQYQVEVKDAMKDFFSVANPLTNAAAGLDLSKDQTRR
ncbi:hypothetical protein D3C74_54900 [compost metagenome]